MTPLLKLLSRLKNGKASTFRGLGIHATDKKIYLYYLAPYDLDRSFRLATSSDGFEFKRSETNPAIFDQSNKVLKIEEISFLSFIRQKGLNYLLFSKLSGFKKQYFLASSRFLSQWKTLSTLTGLKEYGFIVPNYMYKKQYLMIAGENELKLAYSTDLSHWRSEKKPLLSPRPDRFDSSPLKAVSTLATKKGVIVIYQSGRKIGSALLDPKNPPNLVWRSKLPLWEAPPDWQDKKIYSIGTIVLANKIIGYWGLEQEAIYSVVYSLLDTVDHSPEKKISLAKVKENPVLVPRKDSSWESVATFNPAALYDQGKVHLIYRAIGDDYTSVLGYATSHDGVNFSYRSKEPIYAHQENFQLQTSNLQLLNSLYWSGGGFGGSEDPRLTKIGERIYMTYVALDAGLPRVALTSISVDDFRSQRWLWERPVIISPPNVIDKNCVIFPEKIHNKYVIMHRVFPNILIDFEDNLEFDGTRWLKGEYVIGPRAAMWDSRKVGAGAPPLKTKFGWLLIYQAVGEQDSSRYKIGAMILDRSDPTKILYRSDAPILEPTESYENEGFKFGVVYPCGAVLIGDRLFVYYGGADMVICVATAQLNSFLDELIHHRLARLQPVSISVISNPLK